MPNDVSLKLDLQTFPGVLQPALACIVTLMEGAATCPQEIRFRRVTFGKRSRMARTEFRAELFALLGLPDC